MFASDSTANLAFHKKVTYHDYAEWWENITGAPSSQMAEADFFATYGDKLTDGVIGHYSVEIYDSKDLTKPYPYMVLDLGEPTTFDSVWVSGVYTQGSNAFKQFCLKVSDDKENWTEIYNNPNQPLNRTLTEQENPWQVYPIYNIADVSFDAVTARYLWFSCSQYDLADGVSVSEIQVYNGSTVPTQKQKYIRPVNKALEYAVACGVNAEEVKNNILSEYATYEFTDSDGEKLSLALDWSVPSDFSTDAEGQYVFTAKIGEVPEGYSNLYDATVTVIVNVEDVSIRYADGTYNNMLYLPAPELANASAELSSSFMAVLNSPSQDAQVYYTLDGTVPTKESSLYTGPFHVTLTSGSTVLKAVAYADGRYSPVMTHVYDSNNINWALHKKVTYHEYAEWWENITGAPSSQMAEADFFATYGDKLTDGVIGHYSVEIYDSKDLTKPYPYMVLDLGEPTTFNTVWVSGSYNSRGQPFKQFCLKVSDDKENWTEIYNNPNQPLNRTLTEEENPWQIYPIYDIADVSFDAVTARYLWFSCGQYDLADGVSVSEIQVYLKDSAEYKDTGVPIAEDKSYTVNAENGISDEDLYKLLDGSCGNMQNFIVGGEKQALRVGWLFPEGFDSSQAGSYVFYGVPKALPEGTFDLYRAAVVVNVNISADLRDLKTLVADRQSVDTSAYSPESAEVLARALNAAQSYIDDVTKASGFVYKEAVDFHTDAINGAFAALDGAAKQADVDALQSLVDESKQILQNTDGYTGSSLAVLRQATVAAEKLLAGDAVYDSMCAAATADLNAAKDALVSVDKTRLKSLLSECADIEQGDHTAESYAAFARARDDAQSVAGNADSTQLEIDAALEALAAAQSALAKKGDATALIQAIQSASGYSKDDYTAYSYAMLDKAVKEAETLVDSSAEDIQKALESIEDAVAELVNATEYNKLLARYTSLQQRDYTDWTVNKLVKAYEKATLVAEHISFLGNDLSDDGMKAAVEQWQAAFDGLISVADFNKVKIFAVKKTDESRYTPISLLPYRLAVAKAAVLSASEPTADEVSAMIAEIDEVTAALVSRADKSELLEAINSAKAAEDKSAELNAALAEAESVYDDENSSQSEADDACAKLKAQLGSSDGTGDDSAGGTGGRKGCGCGSALDARLGLVGVALAAIACLLIRRRKEDNV